MNPGLRGKAQWLRYSILLASVSLTSPLQSHNSEDQHNDEKRAAHLGELVQRASQAIKSPETPGGMAAIRELGTDSRYYMMVRGWLKFELEVHQSLLQLTESDNRPQLQSRVLFLQRAIRQIDLE